MLCGSLTESQLSFVDLSEQTFEQTPKWQIQEFNGIPYIISFRSSFRFSNLPFPAISYFVVFREMLEAITNDPASL